MSIEQDLIDLDAPTKVREAGRECDAASQAGLRPPRALAEYIQQWVNRNRGNNRYGK